MNQVLCDLISHKKTLLLEQKDKQQKDAVLPSYCFSDTPELHPGLQNCSFQQNVFNFGLVDDQKSFNAACNNVIVFLSNQYGVLNYFKMFSFFSNNTPGGVSTCQILSL